MIGFLVIAAFQTLLHGATDPQPSAPGSDSLAIVKEAKRAQERFERFHRNALPHRHDVWAHRCEERVGRFVFLQSEDGDTLVPAEPEKIAHAREGLLTQLARAQARLPSDGWIAGQRVRYLIDARRPAEAVAVARACQAGPEWCSALAGLALHASGEFAAADSAFAAALARLPEAERCRWTDISMLLRGAPARRYKKLDCAQRAAFEARFWWLARPLFTLEANDLRTEYLARVAMRRIHENSQIVNGLAWGDDLAQHMLRFGWPTAWSQTMRSSFADGPVITEFTASPNFEFLPADTALDDPGRAPADAWNLGADCPRSSYAPAYAKSFVVPQHQAAFFRRGDSAFVVAAYDVSGDSVLAPIALEAALVLAIDERSAPVIETKPQAFARDVLTAKGAWTPQLVSLEVVSREHRRVARGRFGLAPRGGLESGVAVSDLLLFDPPDSLPATLAEVLPHVRGSTRAREGENLGIFWELYGLGEGEMRLSVSLMVTPRGSGLLRRAGESLRLLEPATPVAYHWLEEMRGRGSITPRSLALDLARLSPGRHLIELLVEPAGRPALVVRREIEVVKK